MQEEISRRSAIKLAGLATAGVATATANFAGAKEAAGSAVADATAGADAAPQTTRVLTTDVLIIGAGAAGVRAAIEAANDGADVVIVDKKAWGHCGDSGMHYSGRMTSSDFGLEGDSVDVQLQDAVEVGGYIVNQQFGREVLQGYADDRVTLESENFGDIHVRDSESGKPFIGYSSNKPRLWVGFKLSNMSYNALECGITVFDYCTATKLLQGDDGSAVGAVLLNFKTGEIFAVLAKSVVLATGGDTNLWGAGTIAAQHGGGAVNLTGDGHALAANLGVEFRDLEFRSLYQAFGPMVPSISNFCVFYSSKKDTYQDANGKPLFEGIAPEDLTLRNIIVQYEKAVMDGRVGPRGGVYADIDTPADGNADGVPSNVSGGYIGDLWDQLKVHWEKQGMTWEHMEVGPQSTYDFGGMVTDIKGQTNVDGLFAAGECAMHCGSQYQVFRMFSSALVMGKRAGAAAAERAASMSEVAGLDRSQIDAEVDRVLGLLTNNPANPIRVHDMRRRVQNAAWKGSGALRSEKKCAEAWEELDGVEADLPRMYVADKSRVCNVEWFESLEIANMLDMARMVTLASRTRTESRGTHLRAEYPMQDNDNWVKNVYIYKEDGQFKADVRDTDTSIIPAPAGKVDMGGGVLEGF
ncbi:FAD-binding protein [bacterium]|nr:FAD-binding protein [bacterium]